MKHSAQPGSAAGFSRVEAFAVVVIVAALAILAWPTVQNALAKRELTRTMSNARELYLAAFEMATEGAAKSDATLSWPGDSSATTLADYCAKLVERKYVKAHDLQRILSARGADCIVTSSNGSPATVTLNGKSALKVYKAKRTHPSNTIFAASANYVYDTPLDPSANPFGDSGFVVIRKSGEAGIYKKGDATVDGFDKNASRFQEEIGALPGADKGNVTPGDGPAALTNPN